MSATLTPVDDAGVARARVLNLRVQSACAWSGVVFLSLFLFGWVCPFGYNGALALYLPAGVFFLWFALMTSLLIGAVHR